MRRLAPRQIFSNSPESQPNLQQMRGFSKAQLELKNDHQKKETIERGRKFFSPLKRRSVNGTAFRYSGAMWYTSYRGGSVIKQGYFVGK